MIEDTISTYRIQQKRKQTGTWATIRKVSSRNKAFWLYTKMITSPKVLEYKRGIQMLPEFRLTTVVETVILEDEHMPRGES